MNEAKLKELGVPAEAIKTILDEWERTTGAQAKENDGYRAQIKAYEKQIKELDKLKGDNAQLSEKLTSIQTEQKAAADAFAKEMADYKKTQAVRYAIGTLKDGKAHDPSIVLGLLDMSKVSVDDKGNVVGGFDDQIGALRKDKAFLFEASTPGRKGATPPASAPAAEQPQGNVGSIGARLAAQALAMSKTTVSGQ